MDLGIVKRNRAKQELAMLKAKDPLPLDRAKINQGANEDVKFGRWAEGHPDCEV